MQALVSVMKLEPGHYEEMHAMATSAPERLKLQKGFVSAVSCSDKEKDEYCTISIWETMEDYEAARSSIPAETLEKIQAWSREPAILSTYYVNNAFSAA